MATQSEGVEKFDFPLTMSTTRCRYHLRRGRSDQARDFRWRRSPQIPPDAVPLDPLRPYAGGCRRWMLLRPRHCASDRPGALD
jgi:hypothetical protein